MTPDEKDWKLFKSKISLWQENYINKLNKEYAAILCGDESPSEKFWKLENKINADKKSRGIQIHLRRSNSDNYFESQACLNEAGAIWALKRNYQEILSPQFDNKKIGGLLDKQPVWFKSNDAERLNIFKEQLEKMFELDKCLK